MQLSFARLGIVVAVAALTACGGGGGGAPAGVTAADATVVITANNANQVVRSVNTATSFADGFIAGLIFGLSATSAATVAAVQTGTLVVTPTASDECTGGGDVVIRGGGNNDNFVDFEFTDCVDFLYDGTSLPGTSNGGLRATVTSAVSENDFVATIVFRDFMTNDGATAAAIDGSVGVDYLALFNNQNDLIEERIIFETNLLTGDVDGVTFELIDYDTLVVNTPTELLQDSTGGVESSNFPPGELAFLSTPEDLVTPQGALWPTAGRFLIYGLDGRRIRVQAQSDGINAEITLDLDGVGGFETSPYLITWENLLINPF